MLNCKQVTELISQNLDTPIPWIQRWRIKLHLLMCHSCSAYLKQLKFIQKVLLTMDGHYQDIKLSKQAKQRIVNRLRDKFLKVL